MDNGYLHTLQVLPSFKLITNYLYLHELVGPCPPASTTNKKELKDLVRRLRRHAEIARKARVLFENNERAQPLKSSYFYPLIWYIPPDIRHKYVSDESKWNFEDIYNEMHSCLELAEHLYSHLTQKNMSMEIPEVKQESSSDFDDESKYLYLSDLDYRSDIFTSLESNSIYRAGWVIYKYTVAI